MENAENKLGGGPSGPEEQQALDEAVGKVLEEASAKSGVQVTPTSPSEPMQVERGDLLEYKLFQERAAHTELQVTMYQRELQRSQADSRSVALEASNFLKGLSEKYKVDLRVYMITDDGYLIPRPVDQRAALMRK